MVKDVIKSSSAVARSLWCRCYPLGFFIQIWFRMFVISVFSSSDNFFFVSVLLVIKENVCWPEGSLSKGELKVWLCLCKGTVERTLHRKSRQPPLCIDWPTLEGKLIRYDHNSVYMVINDQNIVLLIVTHLIYSSKYNFTYIF